MTESEISAFIGQNLSSKVSSKCILMFFFVGEKKPKTGWLLEYSPIEEGSNNWEVFYLSGCEKSIIDGCKLEKLEWYECQVSIKNEGSNIPADLSKQEMLATIENSGFPFEQHLCKLFEDEKFLTIPNYRMQSGDKKFLETDLIAIKNYSIKDDPTSPSLKLRLVIEAKNNKSPFVAFTFEKNKDNFSPSYVIHSAVPNEVYPKGIRYQDIDDGILFQDEISLEKLRKDESLILEASQFAQFRPLKSGWTLDQDKVWDIVPKMIEFSELFLTHSKKEVDIPELTVILPMIILNGELMEYRVVKTSQPPELKKKNRIPLQWNTSNGSFFVILITVEAVKEYLAMIDQACIAILNEMIEKRDKLQGSIDNRVFL